MSSRRDALAALDELREAGGRLRLEGGKLIVDWRGPRIPALADKLKAAKPFLMELHRPLSSAAFIEAATHIFNATVLPDDAP